MTNPKKNLKEPPKKRESPVKSPGTPRGKPISGRRSAAQIRADQPRDAGWYLSASLLDGCLAYFTVTLSDPGQDAYTQPLKDEIAKRDSTEEVCQLGILGGYYMRKSLEHDVALLNVKDSYQRKAYILMMEPDEMTTDALLTKLEVVRNFLMKPSNNRYNTKVFIAEDWDMTPPEPRPLPKLDQVIQYKEIVNVIKRMYAGVGPDWYTNNIDAATSYFTPGFIPAEAMTHLGFPAELVIQPTTYHFP
jgi:hypothetical protein